MRQARITDTAAAARPVWEQGHDGSALQQYLKDRGCHGVEAVLVTMEVVGCGLSEAQGLYFGAPCRDADREFHNRALDLLEQTDTPT
ncbi:hypothetical protein AB0D29_31345 [Streptomyces sp. NPDC048424]|uniref:hypothetical protein n=1 Tax=Streptomyces sp. NPDC048424 TaxID=3155265 RepID=UPI003448C1B0